MAKKKITESLASKLTKLEKWSNKPVNTINQDPVIVNMEDKVSQLIRNTYNHFEAIYYPEWNQCYKDDTLYFGDRYMDLVRDKQERRTNIKVPLIATAKDTMVGNMYDINSTIKAVPKTEAGEQAIEEYQKFADSIFYDADVTDTLRQCIDEAILTGNSYARVGYEKKSVVKQYMKGGEIQTMTLEYNKPILDYTSIYELIFDLGAKKFGKTRWKGYRTKASYDDAVSKYEGIFGTKITDQQKQMIIKMPKRISEKDYNKIKEIKFYERKLMTDCEEYYTEMEKVNQRDVAAFNDQNIFQIDYEYNDIIEIVEYREKDRCAILFNGYKVYDGINPYPFDDDPFVHLQYEKTPGFIISRGLGQKLRGHQQNIDIISNLYTDAIKITSAPMFKGFGGKNKDKVLKYRGRGILKDDGLEIDAIKLVDFNSVTAALNALTKIEGDADRTSGLGDYTSGGSGGGIERSYGAVASKVQVLKNRLKPLTDSINRFLTDVIRKMAIMAVTYMPEKFKVRIIGQDGTTSFEEITTESLIHDFDILFDNTVAATKELDFAKRLQVLQAVVPVNQDQLRGGQPIADIKELIASLVRDASVGGNIVITDAQRIKITEDRMATQKKMQEMLGQQGATGGAPIDGGNSPAPGNTPPEPTEGRFDPNAVANQTSKIANQL